MRSGPNQGPCSQWSVHKFVDLLTDTNPDLKSELREIDKFVHDSVGKKKTATKLLQKVFSVFFLITIIVKK